MPTQKKIETVEELTDNISRCTIAVGAEYRGLSVAAMTTLRKQLRQAGVDLRVVKNRLFNLAAQAAGQPQIAELAEGPTAVAFGYGDIVAPAKVITEYMRTAKDAYQPRKVFLEGQILPATQLADLASLPSREVLLGRVAGALQSPLARLAWLLHSTLSNPPGLLLNDSLRTFGGLLEARARQIEA